MWCKTIQIENNTLLVYKMSNDFELYLRVDHIYVMTKSFNNKQERDIYFETLGINKSELDNIFLDFKNNNVFYFSLE